MFDTERLDKLEKDLQILRDDLTYRFGLYDFSYGYNIKDAKAINIMNELVALATALGYKRNIIEATPQKTVYTKEN